MQNIKYFTLINKYIEIWISLALTIFLLGYFFFPTSSKHNTFFYIAVCAPLVFLAPKYYKQLRLLTWLTATALLFSFYLYLNSLWSIHFSSSQSFKYLRYLLTLYCLFAAVFLIQKQSNYSEFLFKGFLFFGFFHSLFGIFNHFNNVTHPLATRYNDPIDSAMLVGFLLLTCFWFISENKDWKKHFFYIIVSIPFVMIILLSKSRGPQLAMLLSIPLVPFFQSQSIKKLILPAILLTFLISCGLYITNTYTDIFSRGLTFPYRIEIWIASLKESFDYFWFGQGASHKPMISIPSSNEKFNHSHNILLVTFRMGGILGVFLFSINLILCFFAALKRDKSIENLWAIWLFFGITCLMSNGKYPLTRPSASWLAYWIPIAFICASSSNFLRIKFNRETDH